jgi:hypothetical protein
MNFGLLRVAVFRNLWAKRLKEAEGGFSLPEMEVLTDYTDLHGMVPRSGTNTISHAIAYAKASAVEGEYRAKRLKSRKRKRVSSESGYKL